MLVISANVLMTSLPSAKVVFGSACDVDGVSGVCPPPQLGRRLLPRYSLRSGLCDA